MIIDFSAHDSWNFCPAAWYEKYVNRRRRRWPKAQRDDALALGSLVHEGLRMWQLHHTVEIPTAVVDEMTPSAECLRLALELVHGYAQTYPEERWPLVHAEEPLVFPLVPSEKVCAICKTPRSWGCGCVSSWQDSEPLDSLAKLDSYFYVPEITDVESGVPGMMFTLTPGWWIHEYKTKAPQVPIALYMQSWEMGLQASYQTLALRHHIRQTINRDNLEYPYDAEVQGVLVNVLEKPRRYIPQRTCKACKEKYEFATWLPTGTGEYACPVCGNRQVLTPLKENTPVQPPSYYRIVVSRSEEQLARDREIIVAVGQQMIQMAAGGLTSFPWNKKSCVDFRYRRACDYWGNHMHNLPTAEDTEMETPADYRGLVQVEVAE